MMKKLNLIIYIFYIVHLSMPIFAQTQQNLDLVIETGHSDSVKAVTYSPDGKLLASGGWDTSVKLWNANTGQLLKTLNGHIGAVNSVVFSPTGKVIASAGEDKTVKLWSVETGELIAILQGHTKHIWAVAFSPDGKIIASGGEDNTIKLWDVKTKMLIRSIRSKFVGRSIVFSPDGKTIVSGNWDKTIKFWDMRSGLPLKTINVDDFSTIYNNNDLDEDVSKAINSVIFSPDGKILASANWDNTVKLWNIETGKLIKNLENNSSQFKTDDFEELYDNSVAFSPDGNFIAFESRGKSIGLWNGKTGQFIKSFKKTDEAIYSVIFSPSGETLVSGGHGGKIKFWNVQTGKIEASLVNNPNRVVSVALSPNGKMIAGSHNPKVKFWDLAFGNQIKSLDIENHATSISFSSDSKTIFWAEIDEPNSSINLWNLQTNELIQTIENKTNDDEPYVNENFTFSSDGNIFAIWKNYEKAKLLKIFNVKTGQLIRSIKVDSWITAATFSHDGRTIVSGGEDKVELWNVVNGKLIKSIKGVQVYNTVALSPNRKLIASASLDNLIKVWNIETGQLVKTFKGHNRNIVSVIFSQNGKFIISGSWDTTLKLWNVGNGQNIATLISFENEGWAVTTPEGRFDTNKSLDNIEGLHWVINNEILNPLPLDVFMRQYYEPGLLQSVLKCNEENSCDKEFKPLPSIAEINRVQPKVLIKDVKASKNSKDEVDITVEVESVSEDVSVSADDRTKKKRETSGVFDLRLFRDGQLVGVSTPKEKQEPFIKDAPNLIKQNEEYFKKTGKLTDTPEDLAWREANSLISVDAKKKTKTYTFKNVKLPKDGKKEVEFTAYAFNEDKVKSQTTEPFKFSLPKEFTEKPKKGRAVLVSIGVNKSETSTYDLRYAANDARKMQEIIGGNLKKEVSKKYSEFIGIPLVSDDKTKDHKKVNTAQKEIIKGVFSLMSGKSYKQVLAEIRKINKDLAKEFESIPNIKRLKQIEPEDTLIISFSGHGVADNSGIFYLLPYDIGKNVSKINTDVLSKTISSDELSLWMQDITASEMIMIIDACYSSSAVGADFKPGPMGSRGLGQLAYDKDMKLLSATQANNVALELNTLEMGLLSYALLQDGVKQKFADADKNNSLLSAELLEYAEKRVPELYQEVKDGKRGAVIDGKKFKPREKGVETFYKENTQKSNVNLQTPKVFDFKRRKRKNTLFILP